MDKINNISGYKGIIVYNWSQYDAARYIFMALRECETPSVGNPFVGEDALVVYYHEELGKVCYASLDNAVEQGMELVEFDNVINVDLF